MRHKFFDCFDLKEGRLETVRSRCSNLLLFLDDHIKWLIVGCSPWQSFPRNITLDPHHLLALLVHLNVDVPPPDLLEAVSPSSHCILHKNGAHHQLQVVGLHLYDMID